MKTSTFIMALFMLFKPLLPVLEYIVFYDYIKTELCINKENIELGCNGKCFLTQEMSKASDITPGKEKKVSLYESTVVYCEDFIQDHLLITTLITLCTYPIFYINFYHKIFSNDILRPPIVLSYNGN